MKNNEAAPTFEAMLADLETIVRELEDGSISLDDALARYEKGVGLLRQCFDKLKSAEQKIQQLTGVDDDGRPLFENAADSEMTAAKAPARRKKSRELTDDED
jgi:exodeoxyribonuclease VII small subunit